MWSVPREWVGQTAFIIGGGPSVAKQDLSLLRGRRVIVVNSSYETFPDAEFLFFGDVRWWVHHKARLALWPGRIVTCAESVQGRVLKLRRVDVALGLSVEPGGVVMGRTSLQGAINLASLLGSPRIVLLGADMGEAPGGRTHHHDPHPWPQRADCYRDQMASLHRSVAPLASLGVEVLNASPVSRLPWWRKVPLEDCL